MSNKDKMKEFEKEFYAHLGLMSIKFAKMEYHLSQILGKLIVNDDTIAMSLIENNNLHQNIEMLKKINRIRGYKESILKNIIEQIGRIKNDRNLFIHGIWGKPMENDHDIVIVCREQKIRYSDIKDNTGIITEKIWTSNKSHVFRLSYIKKQLSNIDNIIVSQQNFIENLQSDIDNQAIFN